jgi:hypothetical protein
MSKRRIKGSGSIYVRKDGRVVGQYEVNGKQRYIYGTSKQDVAAKLTKAIADRDSGVVYDSVVIEKVEGKEMLLYDPANHWGILHILDDDYLESVMTGLSYESSSKRAH